MQILHRLSSFSFLGRALYFLLWPGLWLAGPIFVRVRVFIVSSDNRVLQIKNSFGPNQWNFPGGGVKIGEDFKQTAAREIEEELKIKIKPEDFELLNQKPLVWRQNGVNMRCVFLQVQIDKKADKIDFEPNFEIVDWRWQDYSQAKDFFKK